MLQRCYKDVALISMGGKWGVGKKETCHRPHGVLITIALEGEPKKMVIVQNWSQNPQNAHLGRFPIFS